MNVAAAAPRASLGLAVLLVGTMVLGVVAPAEAARKVNPPHVVPSASERTFGIFTPGTPGDPAAYAAVAAEAGGAPDVVMWYESWGTGGGFPAAAAGAVAARGAVPQITWEPWVAGAGVDQPAYALSRIAAGAFDGYVTTWARQVKAYGKPVQLRFAHEMNGDWYPWSAGVNGNSAADHVAAWRHVRDIFAEVGVTNVTWVWSPNVPYPGSTPLSSLYPGDNAVDTVALDGYNWGTSRSWTTWQSFWDVFGPGVRELQAISTRPIYVAEVGSTEAGGDKAAWIDDMFATLAAHPEIRGFTWFDENKETDWRIASSPSAQAAFQAGLPTFG